MSKKRILWALLWLAWGTFWGIIAYEILALPVGVCIVALFVMIFLYGWAVPNWWAPTSGILTFFITGVGMTVGIKFWSILSPAMEYSGISNIWDTLLSVLFWGYLCLFIFKIGATLEAKYNPRFFNKEYFTALKDGTRWGRE